MKSPEYKRPSREPDIEAEVTFLPTAEGGRKTPAVSGYRPNHDFGLDGETNDAQHEYPEQEWVSPGETARTLLWLLVPELQLGRLFPGFEFTVQEGARLIGRGRVIRVLNSSLRKLNSP